jgi:hypothetical protein
MIIKTLIKEKKKNKNKIPIQLSKPKKKSSMQHGMREERRLETHTVG